MSLDTFRPTEGGMPMDLDSQWQEHYDGMFNQLVNEGRLPSDKGRFELPDDYDGVDILVAGHKYRRAFWPSESPNVYAMLRKLAAGLTPDEHLQNFVLSRATWWGANKHPEYLRVIRTYQGRFQGLSPQLADERARLCAKWWEHKIHWTEAERDRIDVLFKAGQLGEKDAIEFVALHKRKDANAKAYCDARQLERERSGEQQDMGKMMSDAKNAAFERALWQGFSAPEKQRYEELYARYMNDNYNNACAGVPYFGFTPQQIESMVSPDLIERLSTKLAE